MSWAKHNLFEKIWTKLIQSYSNKQLLKNSKWFEDLLIDSSMIQILMVQI